MSGRVGQIARHALYAWGLIALTGCALFGKSEPLDVRYFSPSSAEAAQPPSAGGQGHAHLQLRLGKVSAATHLDRRIVYREQGHELGYYTGLRWTESPDEYVRRGLGEALFEDKGIVRVLSGPAPTLQVELVEFEELKAPRHVGRVVMSVSLFDERTERYRRTFVAEQKIAEEDDPAAAVAALSQALFTAVDEIAGEVVAQLSLQKEEKSNPPARAPERAPERKIEPATPVDPGPNAAINSF
jgi:cholesterol transport system auxiliary component